MHDQDPTAFKVPVTRSFELSAPQSIEWEVVDPDSIPAPKTYPLDIDKLPVRPFSINEFKALKSPIEESPLDYDPQKKIPLQFDTIAVEKKTSILPTPMVTRMNKPRILDGTSSGMLQLSSSEGLPSNEIRKMLQNEDGTYWIATFEAGLCLYDGKDSYTYDYKNIWDIALDQDGKLWVATGNNGVYVLDFKKRTETHFLSKKTILTLLCDYQDNIWMTEWREATWVMDSEMKHLRQITNPGFERGFRLIEDHNHNIWLGHLSSGQNVLSVMGKNRENYTDIYNLGPGHFFQDSDHRMWLSNRNGAMAISLAKKTTTTIDERNGFYGNARLYEEDNQGRLWMIKNDTITVLSKDRTQMKTMVTNSPVSLPQKIGCVMKDAKGVIWIGTLTKGILLIDPDGPLPEHLDVSNGLTSSEIWSFEQAHQGNIWMGSRNNIDIYNPSTGTIKTIGQSIVYNNSANNRISFIKEIEEDKIFVDGVHGFYLIDRTKNVITRYLDDVNLANRVFGALRDESGAYWLTSSNGLAVYNPGTNSLKMLPGSSPQLDSKLVICIEVDGSGRYWIGTDHGLAILDPDKNTIQHLREQEGLCHNNIMKMMQSEDGKLWVATTNGLSVIDPVNQTITNLGEAEGLVPDELYDLREKEGTVYIGSVNGLILVTPPSDQSTPWHFFRYAEAQGFPSNDYKRNAGLLLNNGQLWFGTSPNNKLTILTQDLVTDTSPCPVSITGLRILDENPSFESNAAFLSYFETKDTLLSSNGKQVFMKNTLPPDSGYVFKNNFQWDSLSLPYRIPLGLKLPYNQNSLKFSYTDLSVLNRDKIAYRYILQGADNFWVYNKDISTSKTYFNLSPGMYTFKVESKINNGTWSKPAEFSFTILPPWWQTWWAYGVYGLLFIGGLFIADRFQKQRLIRIERAKAQIRELAQAKEIEKAYHELKTTQSQLVHAEKMASLGELTAGIAHEIQNPLNFINNFSEVNKELLHELKEEIESGNIEDVKDIANDVIENEEKIIHHGKRADGIVKGMLQHSRISSSEKEPIDINQLADEYLRLAYHGLRAKEKSFNADFRLKADQSLPHVNVIPQDIGRVLLNLINNAFYAVHKKSKENIEGYKPEVVISTKKSDNKIEIYIKDNGNGIPEKIKDKIFQPFFTTKSAGEGTGLGLSLSYDIITKGHGGTIEVDTIEGVGTTFIINIPLKS
jgi:signal transduction histidine kinase/ligand-binding sensor domain-containing protein